MKALIRKSLARIGFEIRRVPGRSDGKSLAPYHPGARPFGEAYRQAKWKIIGDAIADHSLVQRFAAAARLPRGFGIGIDERCVEYPWLFSRLSQGPERLLDAGSTFNHDPVITSAVLENKKLFILTLAPEANCFWRRGVSYLYADLRDVPIRDWFYDTIVCVSTLEHVGCDNRLITGNEAHREHLKDDFCLAMREMQRVLRPQGRLLLTVPYGAYRDFGVFQQFDRSLLSRAIEAFGKTVSARETFYRYDHEGWNVATASDCAASEYVGWAAAMWQGKPVPEPWPIEPDKAVAARAVACVELTKA
jgi:SAM-dependent methyltransferase